MGELLGWRSFAALEPFGPLQDDLRATLPAVTIANVFRDKKKRGDAFEPRDFILRPSLGDLSQAVLEAAERDPSVALPPHPDGRRGGKTPGQLLQIVEAMFLSKDSKIKGVDNRKQKPRYLE